MIATNSRRLIRLIVWLLPLGLLAWVMSQQLILFGRVTLRCSAERCDPRIENFAARESEILTGRAKESGDRYRLVTADPVSFDTKLLRSMQQAVVRLTYQNPDSVEHLRLGLLLPGSKYEYFDLADHVPHLITLESTWRMVTDRELTLFVRPTANVRSFESIEDFLSNLPAVKRLATFNVELANVGRIPGYQPASAPAVINTPLRGTHTLHVYVGQDETLNVTLGLQNLNRQPGKDDITVNVRQGSDTILTRAFRDDGNETANGRASDIRTVPITVADLSEGTYQVEVASKKGDFLIRSVEAVQHLLLFDGTVWLAADREYAAAGVQTDGPQTVYVQGTRLTAQTPHQNSLQTITVGSKKLTLQETNKPVTVSLPITQSLVPVTVPRADILLETDGVFVLSSQQFFNRQQFATDRLTDSSKLDRYDYVLTRYVKPQPAGKWLVATKTLTLPADRIVHFAISTDPSLHETNKTLRIRELEVRLSGDPLTPATVGRLIKKFFQRLSSSVP